MLRTTGGGDTRAARTPESIAYSRHPLLDAHRYQLLLLDRRMPIAARISRLRGNLREAREGRRKRGLPAAFERARLFTSVFDDARLLPHFLRHYANAGVRDFYIGVSDELEEEVARLASGYPVTLFRGGVTNSYLWGQANDAIHQLRERYQRDDEWVLIVDLDEFVVFRESIPSVIAAAEAEGANVVRGVMYDRFSADGRTRAVEPDSDLARQYPVRARLVRDVMEGCDHKAVLVKGHLHGAPGSGQHFLEGEKVASTVLEIDHYKWTEGSIDRLKERCHALEQDGIEWRSEYERVIRHFEAHGRFAWEEFGGELLPAEQQHVGEND